MTARAQVRTEGWDAYMMREVVLVVRDRFPRNPIAWAVAGWLREAAVLVEYRGRR